MSRSNWCIIFTLIGSLTLLSGAAAQNNAQVTGGSPEIHRGAEWSAHQEQPNSAKAIAPANIENGEQAVQPECGTPQECRTEQRQKDDLVAQQSMAQAASSQRTATWWQTGVGAAGVLLLILTVIYTHLATRAAINSVATLVAVERARITIEDQGMLTTKDGKTIECKMVLSNVGRTTGTLRETCMTGSVTGLYKDFVPDNIKKHNTLILEQESEFDELSLDIERTGAKFIVGYYRFSTIFSKKLVTDYFCFEIGKMPKIPPRRRRKRPAPGQPLPQHQPRVDVQIPLIYRTDLDWPPDED